MAGRFPSGLSALIAWLVAQTDAAAIHGGRVGVDLDATLPAVRVSLVDGSPQVTGETNYARPELQVECWGRSALEADRLAWTVLPNLPSIVRTQWTAGGVTTYVSGVDVVLGPVADVDDTTGAFRQYFDVELHVHTP